jgi:hypothetical protein
VGCALSSAYGFLSGAWPFGVVEAIWTLVAIHRFGRRMDRPQLIPKPQGAPDRRDRTV